MGLLMQPQQHLAVPVLALFPLESCLEITMEVLGQYFSGKEIGSCASGNCGVSKRDSIQLLTDLHGVFLLMVLLGIWFSYHKQGSCP